MSNPPSTTPPATPPAAKTKEDYEEYYDFVSPQLPTENEQRSFAAAIQAIHQDFKELRVEWENGEKGKKGVWTKKRHDGTEVVLPPEFCRILLFLYSRNFKKHVGVSSRMPAVKQMLRAGMIRRRILQVIQCTGDHNLSFDENYQAHYVRVCLTIHRYFQQTGAFGFVPDMSSVTYYLRVQKSFRSCFLQAPCVAMSYLLCAHGIDVPPPNASRLIRHHFDDDQLIQYIIKDEGGDSIGVFKILEEKFFEREKRHRDPSAIWCHNLEKDSWYKSTIELLKEGPGLVSRFTVPSNFTCAPPSSDLKEKFPDLAHYDKWADIPSNLIPPGVARFTTWNEPAEFIPLLAFIDAGSKEKEHVLVQKWKTVFQKSAEDDGQDTAFTGSVPAADSNSILANDSLGKHGEQSNTGNAPTFTFANDDSDGEDWSHFFDVDSDDDDENSSASYNKEHAEPGEGRDDEETSLLHAMVLIGHRKVDETGYWLLQNSWEGPTQLLEVNTEYLANSCAYLYFYQRDVRSPRRDHHWDKSFVYPSLVAESSRFERNDCEEWSDDLVHPVPQQEPPDLYDILNDWDEE